MKNPPSLKERNLIKGSLRRVFSRSELRQQALQKHIIEHEDLNRPRVTKWTWCAECGVIFPAYLAQVDHRIPLIELDKTLEDYTWDEIINRLWCSIDNLQVLDLQCHRRKSKLETAERRKFKKEKRK